LNEFELNFAGTNPQKSFSIQSSKGQSELKKSFDHSLKGNTFIIEGQKLVMPPSSPSQQDRTQQGLGIIHRFLVL